MDVTTIIGVAASACTAFSSLPQLIKIIEKKDARNVSKGMLSILLLGLGLWVIYGANKGDWIIIVSNSVSFIITALTLAASFRYKRASLSH